MKNKKSGKVNQGKKINRRTVFWAGTVHLWGQLFVGVLLLTGAVIAAFCLLTNGRTQVERAQRSEGNYISLSEYDQVALGMSYDQVAEILGDSGELQSQVEENGTEFSSYLWRGRAGARIQISFMNNAVTSKTQYGLS